MKSVSIDPGDPSSRARTGANAGTARLLRRAGTVLGAVAAALALAGTFAAYLQPDMVFAMATRLASCF